MSPSAIIPGTVAMMDTLIYLADRRRGAFDHREAGPECVPLKASEYLIWPIEELAILGGKKPGSGHTSHGSF